MRRARVMTRVLLVERPQVLACHHVLRLFVMFELMVQNYVQLFGCHLCASQGRRHGRELEPSFLCARGGAGHEIELITRREFALTLQAAFG